MGLEDDVKKFEQYLIEQTRFQVNHNHSLAFSNLLLDSFKKINKFYHEVVPLFTEQAINKKKISEEIYIHHEDGNTVITRNESDIDYENESELLKARHPRRVTRLFEQEISTLEERYGRTFDSRNNFAFMHHLFDRMNVLSSNYEFLKNSISYYDNFISQDLTDETKEMINKYFFDSSLMSKNFSLFYEVLGLVQDMGNPSKFLEDYENRENSSSLGHHVNYYFLADCGINIENYPHDYDNHDDKLIFNVMKKYGDRTISFFEIMQFYNSHLVELFGKKFNHVPFSGVNSNYDLPDFLTSKLESYLKECYDDMRETETGHEEMREFFAWHKDKVLHAWKDTAIDYENPIVFYEGGNEEKLSSLFYFIRNGNYESRTHKDWKPEDRLPGLMRSMMEDGLLDESEIDPPLKEKYLASDQVLTNLGDNLLPAPDMKDALSLFNDVKSPPAQIKTDGLGQKLISFSENKELAVSNLDLIILKNYLDVPEEYELLGKGNHMLFFKKRFKHTLEYIFGVMTPGEIFTASLLETDVKPENGIEIKLNGEKMIIEKYDYHKLSDESINLTFSNNTNFIVPRSYTVIIESSPDEFMEKYSKDFLMHVLLFHHSSAENYYKAFQEVEALKTPHYSIDLGPFGAFDFKTIKVANRMGFHLHLRKDHAQTKFPNVVKTLIGYLKKVGLDYSEYSNLDATKRHEIEYKLKKRDYQDKHLPEILDFLRDDGYLKILCYAIDSNDCDTHYLGSTYGTCEHCGEDIIGGEITYVKDNSYVTIYVQDLHDLTKHHSTFRDWGPNLEKIHKIIYAAKNYDLPIINFSGIETEIKKFANEFDAHLDASSASYDFWYETEGGIIGRYEEEEIEDSLDLQKLLEEENKLHENDQFQSKLSNAAALVLENKYNSIHPKISAEKKDLLEIKKFWTNQLLIYKLYGHCSPKYIPEFTGGIELELPINFGQTKYGSK